MCDYKQLYAPIVKMDSRNAVQLGQAIGGKVGQYIEDEGRQNTQNPGRGLTKAAESVALWYLGGAAGGALGGSGSAAADAGGAAANTAGVTADSLGAAGAFGADVAGPTSQAMQQYLEQAAAQGGGGALQGTSSGLLHAASTVPGEFATNAMNTGPAMYNFGYLAGTQLPAQVSNGAGLLPQVTAGQGDQSAGLLDQAKYYASKMMGGQNPATSASGGSKASNMALRMGLNSMQQPQRPPPPQSPPPRPYQGGPLPTPYGSNSLNDSMPPPGMTMEDWLRLKQQRIGLLGGQQ